MIHEIIRSPLFYVGDKFKLMTQLIKLFPVKVNNYYEPFVGGGTVFLNIQANKYYINDIDTNLINIHKFLIKSSCKPKFFFKNAGKIILEHNLSRSYMDDVIPLNLKKKFIKTYYARFNKEGYLKLREKVNSTTNKNNPLILYILLIYGFNRMLRFNSAGKFNLPVGNVDFNRNVIKALNNYFNFVNKKEIITTSIDFRDYFLNRTYLKDDFIYIDPPYLTTTSEYNKLWDRKSENDLLKIIDNIALNGSKFALSNVTNYNGNTNVTLIKWMKKYHVHDISSNYISYHNNKKKNIREVLITNY